MTSVIAAAPARITRSQVISYDAPTPISVVSEADLLRRNREKIVAALGGAINIIARRTVCQLP